MRGRSATYKGAAGCGQAPSKGRPPAVAAAPRARTAAASPQGTVTSGQAARACCPRRDRKGLLAMPQVAAARPQRVAPWLGLPLARATVGKSGRQQGQRPREAVPPAREVLPEGSNACRRGGCPCRRRAAPPPAQGSGSDGNANGGKERARASF
ncbi:hypothetical protein GW17_00030729 [Ensete ventricosum]|nr:hypothetical protein GW17_00030729 [Ensete ventricosum]RZS22325.1 hypothetical protein BHM03_00055075 [Ensete ventricosum]